MRFKVLACDYDGTLANHGRVDAAVEQSLERLRESGRKIVLVTGRRLDDLATVFPRFERFDRIVAENGALLYCPATRESKLLCEPANEALVERLEKAGVTPLEVGRTIIATEKPHETVVLEAIRDLGLELQVIFNKLSVMVLPSGTNKATGLACALSDLGLSPHNAVAIGDAENDHALLAQSECGVAVGDALPSVRDRADFVTLGGAGAAVSELVERLLSSDLKELEPRLSRHRLSLGAMSDGASVCLPPYGKNVLLAGASGSGKSTLARAFIERLIEHQYQFCLIDPEGDYRHIEGAVVHGDDKHAPTIEESLELLQSPTQNAVIDLLAIPLKDRPAFFATLYLRLQELRTRTGRPHWIVIDEAHHMLPTAWDETGSTFSRDTCNLFMVTVHPDHVAKSALAVTDLFLVAGKAPEDALKAFAKAAGELPVELPALGIEPGEVVGWDRRMGRSAFVFTPAMPKGERRRHHRKYAEGDLGPDRSFYFKGPEGKLSLRAQNLQVFVQIAEGIDDDTWNHHLRRGDYSSWIREYIKDRDLAENLGAIEAMNDVSAAESRSLVRSAIEQRYTLSA